VSDIRAGRCGSPPERPLRGTFVDFGPAADLVPVLDHLAAQVAAAAG
jgi:hypothetical protein